MLNKDLEKVMIGLEKFPVVGVSDTLKKALDSMTSFGLGFACIVNEQGILAGVLTDGDLRRILLTRQNPLPALLVTDAIQFSGQSPKTIGSSASLQDCIDSMKKYHVADLPVISNENKLIGVVHFHDLI
jgi:CBS domain-containing protein